MLMYTGLAWLADAAEMILLFIGPSVTTTYLLYIYLHLESLKIVISSKTTHFQKSIVVSAHGSWQNL
jgi:hypothetical protein